MSMPRKSLIDLLSTPYYHIISRCVRRAFLYGEDELTGKSFEHRRQWVVERFKFLAKNFTIDICAYAVMSNHYHLVLKVDEAQSLAISDKEVVKRWTTMYKGAKAFIAPLLLSDAPDIQTERPTLRWIFQMMQDISTLKLAGMTDCVSGTNEVRVKIIRLFGETACAIYGVKD
jgi:REP element-mobilizing transposase RayT